MPGIQIKPEVLNELQRQLNCELAAAHAYLALAVWCDSQNFKGFASFFQKQSGEEHAHAQKFISHLLDRKAEPELKAIPAPKARFESLLEVGKQARKMEQDNTAGIHAAYAAALRESDFPAQILLQWFVGEQVEEEAWADEMVERIERAGCAGSVAELDRHIERYLTAGKAS